MYTICTHDWWSHNRCFHNDYCTCRKACIRKHHLTFHSTISLRWVKDNGKTWVLHNIVAHSQCAKGTHSSWAYQVLYFMKASTLFHHHYAICATRYMLTVICTAFDSTMSASYSQCPAMGMVHVSGKNSSSLNMKQLEVICTRIPVNKFWSPISKDAGNG